jgi:hypothetical protein
MKKNKFNLGFALLAATALTTSACANDQPLNADNDFACRDQSGRIVDEDFCDNDNGGSNGALMFLWLSSNGYKNKYGKHPSGYNPRAYSGKTTKGFAKSNGISRGGFGSSGRSMSAGS